MLEFDGPWVDRVWFEGFEPPADMASAYASAMPARRSVRPKRPTMAKQSQLRAIRDDTRTSPDGCKPCPVCGKSMPWTPERGFNLHMFAHHKNGDIEYDMMTAA